MSEIIARLNDKVNDHLWDCPVCRPTITLNVAYVQLLSQNIVDGYAYKGYLSPDDMRHFERANHILRKRIRRVHIARLHAM